MSQFVLYEPATCSLISWLRNIRRQAASTLANSVYLSLWLRHCKRLLPLNWFALLFFYDQIRSLWLKTEDSPPDINNDNHLSALKSPISLTLRSGLLPKTSKTSAHSCFCPRYQPSKPVTRTPNILSPSKSKPAT